MALSAREQVELWLTSHPRQYFTTVELAKALHFHPGTVRKVLAKLRSAGWQFEQYGGGTAMDQRYIGQGPGAQQVLGREPSKDDVRDRVDDLAAALAALEPDQRRAWLIGLCTRLDQAGALDDVLDDLWHTLRDRAALGRWPGTGTGRAWGAALKDADRNDDKK